MPESQAAVLRKLRACAARYEKAQATMEALTVERGDLFVAARECDPPITWKAIADIFGVTEAAITQKVKRHQRSDAA